MITTRDEVKLIIASTVTWQCSLYGNDADTVGKKLLFVDDDVDVVDVSVYNLFKNKNTALLDLRLFISIVDLKQHYHVALDFDWYSSRTSRISRMSRVNRKESFVR